MIDGRFAISVHILALLEMSKGELCSSEYLAGSININPVLVRKELGNLRRHGLVESREGKNGGSTLARPASQILLSDVYKAVRQDFILGKAKNMPNPECIVGRQINDHLGSVYADAEQALLRSLGRTTLAQFYKKFI